MIKPLTFFGALFFFSNYTPILTSYVIAHTWSLSIEEQFYLLWPTVISRFGYQRILQICFGLILIAPIVRVFHYIAFPASRADMWQFTHIRYDSLMMGCTISLLKENLRFTSLCGKAIRYNLQWAAILFFWIVSPMLHRTFGGYYTMTVGYSVDALSIGLAVIWATQLQSHSITFRFLNSRIARHFGVLSYSLYLWQQVFTMGLSGAVSIFPLNLLCIWCAAEASYHFIEKPMLKARAHFMDGIAPQVSQLQSPLLARSPS